MIQLKPNDWMHVEVLRADHGAASRWYLGRHENGVPFLTQLVDMSGSWMVGELYGMEAYLKGRYGTEVRVIMVPMTAATCIPSSVTKLWAST